MTGWRSWHLHIATFAPGALDRVITEALSPLADRLGLLRPDGPPWFFLRYWQGGPHLRVRIHGLDEAAAVAVETFLTERMDAWIDPAQRLDQAGYDRAVGPIAASGEGGIALPVGELLPPGVHRAAYEPEYERYGGRALIGVTEDLFHRSSQVSLRVSQARAGTRHGFASVLEATAAAGSILETDRLVPFLTAQQDYWMSWAGANGSPDRMRHQLAATAQEQLAVLGPMADQLNQAMLHGDPRWAPWTDPLAAARRRWTAELGPAAAGRILGSHIHMTANRLGAGAEREAPVAALLLAVLGPRFASGMAPANGSDRGANAR